MTDVLKIALDKRAQLHEEVAKLNEFIRYAESLLRTAQNDGGEGSTASRTSSKQQADDDGAEGSDVPRPSIIRRGA